MKDEKGFFTISRKLKESWLYPLNTGRKFTEYEAWIYIIENARYCCSEPQLINGKEIIIPRGYFTTTVDYLSTIFKWNNRTTEKFLKLLEKDHKITRFKINKQMKRSYTLLKVNNYNEYQPQVYEVCNSEYKTKCHLNCKHCKEGKEAKIPTKPKKEKEAKHIYGEYKNIKLTDKELERLESEYGKAQVEKVINFLSSYKKEKNYVTKDDNLTIRRWVLDACKVSKKIDNSLLNENYGGF